MGRDVKRYFGDFHSFLDLRAAVGFPEEVPFGRPRPVRLARGVRQPVRGSWRWSWRGQGFVEPNRAGESWFFQAAAAEQRGRAASLRSRALLIVADRDDKRCAWIRVLLEVSPSGRCAPEGNHFPAA